MGASPTPDTSGARNVQSAFLELAVPIVSPDMNIPFVRTLDAQFAVRHENYTLFGDVTKPRVAVAWRPIDSLLFRGSWSEGFRAPNLPQQFERGLLRSNTRTDWVRCEAQLRKNLIANFDQCTSSISVQSNRSGSETLKPEESENFTAGFVYQPEFVPERFGEVTFTADYWKVEQTNVIGIFGDSNHITLDYLNRVQGSENPNLLRADPTDEDIALFDGTGIDPAGLIVQAIDNYTNLSPREAAGYDFTVNYDVDDTPAGDFSMRLNLARLTEFFQTPGPDQQLLLDGQADGTIDDTITVVGAESLVEQNGRPKWRASGSVTWRKDNLGVGYFASYVGPVDDTSASLADGTTFRVDDWLIHSLYVQYTLDVYGETRLRLGARNITNEEPPLADTDTGFLGDLHSARGRTVYASIRKEF
jgi:outer membrane receptor protein involved in Fe transport